MVELKFSRKVKIKTVVCIKLTKSKNKEEKKVNIERYKIVKKKATMGVKIMKKKLYRFTKGK